MTGAFANGIPLLAMEKVAAGSLEEAINQISENQIGLNNMFREVIMDFNMQLIENQGIVIEKQDEIVNALNDVGGFMRELQQTLALVVQVLNQMTNTAE